MLVFISALASCTQTGDHRERSSKLPDDQSLAISIIDTICFERYSGLQKQDTASVKLIISGTDVNGDYSNFPYQKDARIGTITGKRSGNQIKGIWRYKQEGMNDSIPFAFRLAGEKMWQKASSFDPASGREFLSDTSSFSILFTEIDCKGVDYRMRNKHH